MCVILCNKKVYPICLISPELGTKITFFFLRDRGSMSGGVGRQRGIQRHLSRLRMVSAEPGVGLALTKL